MLSHDLRRAHSAFCNTQSRKLLSCISLLLVKDRLDVSRFQIVPDFSCEALQFLEHAVHNVDCGRQARQSQKMLESCMAKLVDATTHVVCIRSMSKRAAKGA